MSVSQRGHQRLLVDDLPARGVDDHGAPLQLADQCCVDEALRLGGVWHVHAERVRLREHLVEARPIEVLAPRGRVWGGAPAVVEYAHREGVRELREAQADPAEPEDRERASSEVPRAPRGVPGLPVPGTQATLARGEVAQSGDEQVKRGGGSRVVDCAGRVGHPYAARRAGGDVDLVVARAHVGDPLDGGWECGDE